MAKEITVQAKLNASKGGAAFTSDDTFTMNMAGTTFISNIQDIGTTSEALDLGDVASPGVIKLKNLDATNDVVFSLVNPATSSGAFCWLAPGQAGVFPCRQGTIYARAYGSGSVKALIQAVSA